MRFAEGDDLKTKDRRYSLDILRFAAMVLIILHHYQQITGVRYEKINFYSDAKPVVAMAVEFFFVLSGYLSIGAIKRVENGESFGRFYLAKRRRLLPLIAVSVVVYEGLIFVATRSMPDMQWVYGLGVNLFGSVITCLGVQCGWGFPNPMINNPMWYVSVLLWCYVVLYIIVWLSVRLKVSKIPMCIFMIFIGAGVFTYSINLPFVNSDMARGYMSFFTGVVLASYIDLKGKNARLAILGAVITVAVITAMVFCWNAIAGSFNYVFIFLLFPALIVVFDSSLFNRMFNHKLLRVLGELAFDTYVWHIVVMLALWMLQYKGVLNVDIRSVTIMIGYTIVCLICGAISRIVTVLISHRGVASVNDNK